jgi:hypothetical protein
MTALVDKLPEFKRLRAEELSDYIGNEGWNDRTYGAALRALRDMLDEVDKNHVWGGLSRTVTPEGDILWLCDEHRKEYLR